MIKNYFLLFLFFLTVTVAFSQEKKITGTITSTEDQLGIPGASILIKGTLVGTISDLEGMFSIDGVKPTDTLVFKYVGFETVEIAVGNQKSIDLEMYPNAQELEEVVITALGIERQKREIGFLTQKVDGNVIVRSSSPNVLSSLTGRAAGVQVTNGDGVEGGSTRVTIRGNNNLTTNNQPLIVVDGVPMDNSPGMTSIRTGVDWGNSLNNLNAYDIEDQTVLSGGQASALYGSRGANGVIEIRTKKGSKHKGIGVQYNFSYKMTNPYRYRDLQNKYGSGGPVSLNGPMFDSIKFGGDTLAYPAFDNSILILNQEGSQSSSSAEFGYYGDAVSWGPEMQGQEIVWWDGEMRNYTPQPENLQSVYQNGYTMTNNIALSGGGEKGTMRVSLTRQDLKPIIENSNSNQTTISFAGNLKLSDKVRADLAFSYMNYNRLNSPEVGESRTAFSKGYLYSWGRSYKGLDKVNYELPDGSRNEQEGYPFPYVSPYLWWDYYNNNTTLSRDKYLGSLTLYYDITPWLNLMGRAGRDYNLNQYTTTKKPTDVIGLQGGDYSNRLQRNISNNLDGMLSAKKDEIFDTKLNVKLTVGGSLWEQDYYAIGGSSGTWYYPDYYSFGNFTETSYYSGLDENGNVVTIVDEAGNTASSMQTSESRVSRQTNSVFSFLNLSYDNYLFLDLTARNDWSSTLPTDNNSYFYPSVSLSFIASEAFSLQEKVNWLNFLKIRGGAAQTATDASPYLTEFYYSTGFFGGDQVSYYPGTIPPANLKPQRVNSYEGGLNIGVLDNKIDFDFTYFYIYSFDQIIPGLPVPSSSGATSITTNDGIMTNQGYEIILNAVPYRRNSFLFRTGINFTHNTNKVVSLGGYAELIEIGNIWGNNGPAMILTEGADYGTISGYDYIYHENGQPILNETGTAYEITDTRVPIGNASPDFLAGWTTEFHYKGFTLGTLIDTKWGGDIYCGSYVIGLQTGQSPETLVERDGGGLPYTAPDGSTHNWGVVLPGVYENGTTNDEVVHYYYKYMPNVGGWGPVISTPGIIENSWVKMREISLSYSFNPGWIQKSKVFQALTLSVVGRDLFYIYTTLPDNINPEGILGSGNAQGFEWASYPGVRSITFSLNASF